MSKHIYKGTEYVGAVFDEITDEDILEIHPNAHILEKYIEYPKLVGDKLISMDVEEIKEEKYKRYSEGKYHLLSNEIIEGNKIINVVLNDYEYIENGKLKFDAEHKREVLINKTKTYEQEEKERPFMYKGYLQPNRELEDQTSLLKILSFMTMTKQPKFDNWKMKDLDGHEHYVSLTIQEMMELGQLMQVQTTQAMIKWSKIRESIKDMTPEELRGYEINR